MDVEKHKLEPQAVPPLDFRDMGLNVLGPYTVLILSILAHVNAAAERNPTPEDYLRLHNDLRAVKNAEPLTWNDELAMYAQNWADKCVRRHSKGQWGGTSYQLVIFARSNILMLDGFHRKPGVGIR
ncbi:hypothetical protein AAF712_013501 [Marasmius tenuissimus]|uniref:SCP domain-containing protein n=1 Tax=Marasmius tenuissimus TaxID=585030 RepID=A0ABR2ZDS3_9AGAR